MDADPTFWSWTPVCVIGGSGFLGAHLTRRLLGLGAAVRTLSLPGRDPHPTPPSPRLDTLAGDIRDPAVVRAAVAGARVVFLTAGPVAIGRDRDSLRTHADGLQSLFSVAPAGVRIVLTSSIVTVGATRAGGVLSEDSVFDLDRLGVGYVAAKRAAEAEALRAAAGRDVVVVNPGYLFGPDDPAPSVMGRVCVRFWRGRIPFAPPGGLNAADVRDVATGHLLAAERGASGRRYILGGENLTYAALFTRLAAAAGASPVWLPRLPRLAYTALAYCAEGHGRVSGREPYPSLEHARMSRLFWYCSSARAGEELGYRPRPLPETLLDAYHWHDACGKATPRGIHRLLFRRAG